MTTILVDLDGTLCNASHRAHMISGVDGEPNWEDYSLACYADKPVHGVIRLVAELHDAGNRIIIASGRSHVAMERTIKWLYMNHVRHDEIVLRQAGDFRRNDEVKVDIVKALRDRGERVILAIDDMQEVADAMLHIAVPCLLVAKDGVTHPTRRVGKAKTY